MIVRSAWSWVVGGRTRALAGSSALLALQPDAGRETVAVLGDGVILARVCIE